MLLRFVACPCLLAERAPPSSLHVVDFFRRRVKAPGWFSAHYSHYVILRAAVDHSLKTTQLRRDDEARTLRHREYERLALALRE